MKGLIAILMTLLILGGMALLQLGIKEQIHPLLIFGTSFFWMFCPLGFAYLYGRRINMEG